MKSGEKVDQKQAEDAYLSPLVTYGWMALITYPRLYFKEDVKFVSPTVGYNAKSATSVVIKTKKKRVGMNIMATLMTVDYICANVYANFG